MLQAELLDGAARRDVLDEAADILLRAERDEPGIGAWDLACIHAREGSMELCGRWLDRGHTNAQLPTRDTMISSAYFAGPRLQRWLKQKLDTF